MLKEDIKEGGLAVDLRREEEVARGRGEFRVDETATRQAQRRPVDAASELARQVPLKKRAGVVGIRKGRLDELVMRLVDRTICHEGKESVKNKKWKAENSSGKTPIEVQDSDRASSRMGQFQLDRMKISQNKSHRSRLSQAGTITGRLSTVQGRDGARPSKPFL